jgi:hypothetical protein
MILLRTHIFRFSARALYVDAVHMLPNIRNELIN